MSTVEIDGVGYEVAPEVAGLLQAVSEERDELKTTLEPIVEIKTWMKETNVTFDKYATALAERIDAAEAVLKPNDKVEFQEGSEV